MRIWPAIMAFFWIGSAAAETVEFSNGDKISGFVHRLSVAVVLIETSYGSYEVPRDFVRRLRFDAKRKGLRKRGKLPAFPLR